MLFWIILIPSLVLLSKMVDITLKKWLKTEKFSFTDWIVNFLLYMLYAIPFTHALNIVLTQLNLR